MIPNAIMCRNQPHFFAQAYRYGLDRFIKTSNGTEKPEKAIYKPATGTPHEIDVQEMDRSMENIGQAFFSPDGLTSRELMPYPHDPFRAPALWTRYDHLSLKDRMDQLQGFTSQEKEHFEALMTSIGSAPGTDIGFVEPLRWFALGGHTVSGMFEIIETFKLGAGGQTALARSMLNDYRGHVKMQIPVKKIDQSSKGVVVTSSTGRAFEAKYAVCTIPL